jgi:hypothetical protein
MFIVRHRLALPEVRDPPPFSSMLDKLPSQFSIRANSDRRLLGMSCSGPPQITRRSSRASTLLPRRVVVGKPRERVYSEPF